jgi:hypothetical protein
MKAALKFFNDSVWWRIAVIYAWLAVVGPFGSYDSCAQPVDQFVSPDYRYLAVPNDYDVKMSPDSSDTPFYNLFHPQPNSHTGSRYQQVYAASQFTNLPLEGAFIIGMWFRGGCGGNNSASIQEFELRFSTTPKQPDQLSTNFSENIGPDQVVAVPSPLVYHATGVASTHCGPGQLTNASLIRWGGELRTIVPFFYNPARGNLLMEIRHGTARLEADDSSKFFFSEIVKEEGDSISRLSSGASRDAVSGNLVDTAGLVTQFWFAARPALQAIEEGGKVYIYWANNPQPMHLQKLVGAITASNWQDVFGIKPSADIWRLITLQASELSTCPTYFRLYWDSPQLGLDLSTHPLYPPKRQ